MTSRWSVAAQVANSKRNHPEQFCPVELCLWRTGGGRCPRHPALIVQQDDREQGMWDGLVATFTRILETPRSPEDAARQLAQVLRLNYDVAVKPETRIR